MKYKASGTNRLLDDMIAYVWHVQSVKREGTIREYVDELKHMLLKHLNHDGKKR